MSDAISQHKRMAMGESTPLAKGKAVIPRFANGGAVMAESKVANLPAKGEVMPVVKGTGEKIATYKNGGKAKMRGLTIAIALTRKAMTRKK